LLLHNDPVALACDLAEQHWPEVNKLKLANFNKVRQALLEKWQFGSS